MGIVVFLLSVLKSVLVMSRRLWLRVVSILLVMKLLLPDLWGHCAVLVSNYLVVYRHLRVILCNRRFEIVILLLYVCLVCLRVVMKCLCGLDTYLCILLGSVWYVVRFLTVLGLAGPGGLLTRSMTCTRGNLRSVVDTTAVWMIVVLLWQDGTTMATDSAEREKRVLTLVWGMCKRLCAWHSVFR